MDQRIVFVALGALKKQQSLETVIGDDIPVFTASIFWEIVDGPLESSLNLVLVCGQVHLQKCL